MHTRALAQLTTARFVGIIANMDAVLIFQLKKLVEDEFILEMVVWKVPESISGSDHLYKYRFFFGTHGRRIIGYDNERGKGDHRHHEGAESSYAFHGLRALRHDFEEDVEKWLTSSKER